MSSAEMRIMQGAAWSQHQLHGSGSIAAKPQPLDNAAAAAAPQCTLPPANHPEHPVHDRRHIGVELGGALRCRLLMHYRFGPVRSLWSSTLR